MTVQTKLGRAVLLVEDYDKAYAFYESNFFCRKLFDFTNPGGQRFLHICFSDNENIGVWFLKGENQLQQKLVGNQTGGQPTLVIYTDDIDKLFRHVQGNGVTITETLVQRGESKFFHCLDLYGNRLTIVELP
jgi:predicted enzyme related to lactoylglutathione lyase